VEGGRRWPARGQLRAKRGPMFRVRTLITGTPVVGGGISNFYFSESVGTAATVVAAVQAFWAALLGTMNSAITLSTQGQVDTLDPTSGLLTDSFNVTPVTQVGGDGGEVLPYATQGLVKWRTADIVNGRRVLGRTFVPGPCEARNNAGVPIAGYVTALDAAAAAMIAAANADFVIWHRPGDGGTPPGSEHFVTAGQAWTNWGSLRSRRT